MKKTLFTLLAMMLSVGVFAQISTGEPNSSVSPRTGNRPQAGDFGMYLGASVTQIMDLVKYNRPQTGGIDSKYWALPLVNLKYYVTDNWEVRCGFQFAAYGTTDVASDGEDYKQVDARDVHYTRFLPGAAYHFNTNNILDVYVGAQMPIGFNVDATRGKTVRGDNVAKTYEREGVFVIGGGIFLGLQVFVADLPFAIGLELGYSGQAKLGGGHRKTFSDGDGNKQTIIIGDGGKADEWIGDQQNILAQGEKANATHMEGRWGADAALTFTYYFRK